MDEAKRQHLVALLAPFINENDCYRPAPFVPVELFFAGNDDVGSIGCNLAGHPGIDAFRRTLSSLRADPAVSGVWVLVKQHDWKPAWPHSDEIVVRTQLDEVRVRARLADLRPDTVERFAMSDVTHDIAGASLACAAGEHHVAAWWD